MTDEQPSGISDLLQGLEHLFWEGEDAMFTAYVAQTFGIPAEALLTIAITPRGSRGRSAVSVGSGAGAIVFVITPDARARKTRIAPFVLGPFVTNPDIVARAHQSDGDANMQAVSGLLVRHVPQEVVLDLLAPSAD